MDFKKEDFVKIRSFEDKYFYGLRKDFFDNMETVEEFKEEEPGPTPEELERIAKQKAIEEKKKKLQEELAKLEVE